MSDLRLVPGIGAKKEEELMELGYHSLAELKDADPDELYFYVLREERLAAGQVCIICIPLCSCVRKGFCS